MSTPAKELRDTTPSAPGRWDVLRRRVGTLSGLVLLGLLVAVLLLTHASEFLALANLSGLLRHSTALLFLAVGLTSVVMVGEFDLSFPSLVALSSLVSAGMLEDGHSTGAVVVVVLAMGLAAGLANGFLVSVLGLVSFVATIGTAGVLTAAALQYSGGRPKIVPESATLRSFSKGNVFGIPVFVIVVVLILLVCYVVFERAEIGFRMRGVGENPLAARIAGISPAVIKTAAFCLMGMSAALAGLFIAADQAAGFPEAGAGFLFDAYAAVFVGAVTFRTGHFNLAGTVVGVLVLGLLFNGLNLLGVQSAQREIVSGVALLVALGLARLAGERPAR